MERTDTAHILQSFPPFIRKALEEKNMDSLLRTKRRLKEILLDANNNIFISSDTFPLRSEKTSL